jgi:HAD superfamily hydrolase (TIGR01509 family)
VKLADIVRGVRLLSLDAGNTVIFLDHARLAEVVSRHGKKTDAATLIRTEGAAKRRHAKGGLAEMVDVDWPHRDAPGARGWGAMVATIATEAGLPEDAVPAFLEDAWKVHSARNFWDRVPEGFGDAIERARRHGVQIVLVSNSEGMLAELFTELGIVEHFDLLLDSGIIGLEKPDPRFFEVALKKLRVAPDEALHLGDMYSTDIVGARAAKMRAALIDPYAHYEGMYPDVPRVPGVVEVALALAHA